MQVQLNFSVDLGTAAGRAEFQRMFEHLFMRPDDVNRSLGSLVERVPGTFPNTGSSIPDDPVRAAAALAGRQEAAAKARAAKAAKAKAEAANAAAGMSGPVEAVLGPDDDLSGPETNGDATDPDDLGLADPSMSPGEAKEAGLVLVRQMFHAGKQPQIKALQKRWGVAKFYDVPVERAYEFYRETLKLSHELMGASA